MSRKDFQLVAKVIRASTDTDSAERIRLAHRFAREFKVVNPRFDSTRFFSACGLSLPPAR